MVILRRREGNQKEMNKWETVSGKAPFSLAKLVGLGGHVLDWLINTTSLKDPSEEAGVPGAPDQAPGEWKYFHIVNDIGFLPNLLVEKTEGPRGVAPMTEIGFAYAATYVWSERRQEILMEVSVYRGVKLWVNDRVLCDFQTKEEFKPDDNVCRVTIEEGPNLVMMEMSHQQPCYFGVRIYGTDHTPLEDVGIALSSKDKTWNPPVGIVIGRYPNEADVERNCVEEVNPRYSPFHYFNRLSNEPVPYRFRGETMEDWRCWQRITYKKYMELLGDFPEDQCLKSNLLSRTDEGEYFKETVELEVERDLWMPVFVLIPKNLSRNGATVIYIGGHGGADTERAEPARQCARRGYVALAVESRFMFNRSDPVEPRTTMFTQGAKLAPHGCFTQNLCDISHSRLQEYGRSLMAMNVWDLMRTVDYAQSRPEVDPERIGCSGISLASHYSLSFAAADQRIKAAMCACSVRSEKMANLIINEQCGGHYIPGLLKFMDKHELCGLVAPRELRIDYGCYNTHNSVSDLYRDVKRIYAAAGVEDAFCIELFVGGHEYNGSEHVDWFDEKL